MTQPASPKILVVDDEELNRGLTALQLSRLGYSVTPAADGAAALALLAAQKFDLVLLDIDMPGMNGLGVVDVIRRGQSALVLPIIMATANDHADTLVDALRRGANDYLVKPINIQVAAARIRTQLSLRELVRMKDEFLAFASHDLKKPLMLEEDALAHLRAELTPGNTIGADVPETLDLLLKVNRDMQNVVREFLDGHARGIENTTTGRVAVALNGVVEQVVRDNANYGRQKRVRLETALDPSGPVTCTDAFRLRQVLENLANNALKFSPPDTVTTVATRAEGDEVVIEVRDGGPGLRDDDLDKLFQKNARLSNRPTGGEHSSGVGLVLCKELVTQLGGRIGAHNNADGGATFWIRLPRSA